MRNIEELRLSLLDNYNKMKSGEMDLKQGKELSNCAGKVLQSLKVDLEYQGLMGTKKRIKFFE